MCKFCDSNKEKNVLSYDNLGSMNIFCGQYQGVSVSAGLTIKGNMLILNGGGNYRSRSDCYYEDQGLECDGESAWQTEPSYIKIEYCPFCGKKLDSTEFEKKKTKDTIEAVKYNLKEKRKKLVNSGLHATFTLQTKGPHDTHKAYVMVWGEDDNHLNHLPIPFETIIKNFNTLKVSITYGIFNEYEFPFPAFNPEEGIKFNGSSCTNGNGKFYGNSYSITEEQYGMLVEKGLIKKNNKKLNEMKAKQAKCQEDIKNLEIKLKQLEAKLKKL